VCLLLQSLACSSVQVSSPTDTSNFDVDDNDIRVSDAQPPSHNPGKYFDTFLSYQVNIIGF